MKIAVVLFNLGGPDSPEAVKPFLFNLFNDPAILRVPAPFRWILARLISARRAPVAQQIYAELGGKSPIIEETEGQRDALDGALADEADTYKTFIAMRYWHPGSDEAAAAVKDWGAERVILLPLYPQYSTTTTGSSLSAWHRAARRAGLDASTTAICCYFTHADFIAAHAEKIRENFTDLDRDKTRVLFSAHGLPEKIVKSGDPYQWQVEQTVAAVVAALGHDLDYSICYQSRVGPLAWIGPSTDSEIERAGEDGKNLVVVPIAFVSEHSETLVELDIEYGRLAAQAGVPDYRRVPALGTHSRFIDALAALVKSAPAAGIHPGGPTVCPQDWRSCALKQGGDIG